jgi:hypothetical protein
MTGKTEGKDDKNRKTVALVMECLLSCAFSEDEEAALIRAENGVSDAVSHFDRLR